MHNTTHNKAEDVRYRAWVSIAVRGGGRTLREIREHDSLDEVAGAEKSGRKRTVSSAAERHVYTVLCFRIFFPATRSRTSLRNFSRSAGLSMSTFRFIASATILA